MSLPDLLTVLNIKNYLIDPQTCGNKALVVAPSPWEEKIRQKLPTN